ncbi:MAG: hypothetical protein V5A88_01555 [Candidatus Thermoplasmatota archaeon]
MVVLILSSLVLILAVYSAVLSYLYFKKREEEMKNSQIPEGKVELKIQDTKERLKEIRSRRYPKVKLEEMRNI